MPNHHSGHPLTTEIERGAATNTAAPVLHPLEQTAQELAARHQQLGPVSSPAYLIQRVDDQEKRLEAAHQAFAHPAAKDLVYTSAAEWLLDNYYIVEQALRQIKEDLPTGYYEELPKLDENSPYRGYPRVYALAHTFTLLEKCQFELSRIQRFALAYQEITPLAMGELWALPIMLRLVILESLTQALGRLTATADGPPDTLPEAIRCICDISDDEVVANCILSLRMLANQNWQLFFEAVSQVEQILRLDPVHLYSQMDFDTRDR